MKARLEFELPEENDDLAMALKAGDYLCALDTVSEMLRREASAAMVKEIEERGLDAREPEYMKRVCAEFAQILKDYGVRL